jgi:phospholipid/cholesterol/gamma-HCH transport system substrate-binding protein
MQSARETLRTFDKILVDNAQPLHETIENLKIFSGALARNSDRLDTIVDGLARMLSGPAKSNPRIHDLTAPREFPERNDIPSGQLAVAEPSSVVALDTQRILLRSEQGTSPAFPDDQWADTMPKLFQARVIQSFENAHFTGIAKTSEGFTAEQELQIDIRTFHVSAGAQPVAEVEFSGKIVQNGRVTAARLFRATVPFSDVDPAQATKALSTAFTKAVTELVGWTLGVIS